MIRLPSQFRPMSSSSESASVWFFVFIRLRLLVALDLVDKSCRDVVYVVVTVLPSLLVLLPLVLRSCADGICPSGMTYTGSDADTRALAFLRGAMFLGSLNVVVTVVPSLTVLLSSLLKGRSGGRSSIGMILTGSTASTMERDELSAFATGLAKEELMQKRAYMIAMESRGW